MSLDPRLQGIVRNRNGKLVWVAPDRTVVLPDAEAANRILARVDALRGSPLTWRQLSNGVDRIDDRTREQRLREDVKNSRHEDYFAQPNNPYLAHLEEHDEIYAPHRSIREQVRDDYIRKAEEFEAALHADAPKEPHPARLGQASEHYLVAVYSSAPVTALQLTSRMLDAAEADDGKTYSALHAEFKAAAEARLQAADAKLTADQIRVAEERAALGDSEFDATAPADANTQD